MAYFERADERDMLILCNICNVKCAERGITAHRVRCAARPEYKIKFEKGELVICEYDSSHIIKRGETDAHLEFCTKHQTELVGEFQEATRPEQTLEIQPKHPKLEIELGSENWSSDPEYPKFVLKLGNLKL